MLASPKCSLPGPASLCLGPLAWPSGGTGRLPASTWPSLLVSKCGCSSGGLHSTDSVVSPQAGLKAFSGFLSPRGLAGPGRAGPSPPLRPGFLPSPLPFCLQPPSSSRVPVMPCFPQHTDFAHQAPHSGHSPLSPSSLLPGAAWVSHPQGSLPWSCTRHTHDLGHVSSWHLPQLVTMPSWCDPPPGAGCP